MRLSTCVALEVFVGASLVSGLGISVTLGVHEVRDKWQREAQAAQISHSILTDQLPAPESAQPLAVPAAHTTAKVETGLEAGVLPGAGLDHASLVALEQMPRSEIPIAGEPVYPGTAGTSYYGTFSGQDDEALLAPLRQSKIARVKFNRGGSSISLRIDFENGAQAAFKPVQSAPQTVPRKEIAAYRINRLLGLNAVPPAIGRSFSADELMAAVVPSSQVFLPRLKEEMSVRGDLVDGEVSWWIPVIYKARVQGYEIDTTDGIVTWKRLLSVGNDMPPDEVGLLGQISSMVLFDFVINNPDRWSGANARISEDEKTLYFMDNTMSFGPDPEGHRKSRIYLKRSQKFSRSLVHALRTLEEEHVRAVLEEDRGPFDHLLTSDEITALVLRRDYAIAYVDELIAEHGEDAVLVFP